MLRLIILSIFRLFVKRRCARCNKSRPMYGTGHICVNCIDVLFGGHDD